MDLANPYITYNADDSITIEWKLDAGIFGLSLESDGKQSWYLIREDQASDWCECGYLPSEMKIEIERSGAES